MTDHSIKYIYWELSNYCNLHCLHCFAHATNKIETIVPKQNLFDAIDNLHNQHPIPAIRFGGGEPFLVDYILELIQFCTKRKIDVDVTTNGLLLTPLFVDKLSHTGLHEITVSIDGLEDTHNQIRGKQTYQKSKEAIKRLLSHVEFTVSVSFTVTRINYSEIRRFVEVFSSIGIRKFYFFRYCGNNNRNIFDLELEHLLSAANDIIYLSSHYKDYKFIHEKAGFYTFLNTGLQYCEGCNFANGIITIDYKGNVVVCAAIDKVIGNIYHEETDKLYQKIKLEQSHIKAIPQECRQCQFQLSCHGGCKAASYLKSHNYYTKDPLCLKDHS